MIIHSAKKDPRLSTSCDEKISTFTIYIVTLVKLLEIKRQASDVPNTQPSPPGLSISDLCWHQNPPLHDDVIKWKDFPRNWPFVCGEFTGSGEFPTQRPVTRSFDVFFDLHLNKWLSKQP